MTGAGLTEHDTDGSTTGDDMAKPRGTWRQRLRHARKAKHASDLRCAIMAEQIRNLEWAVGALTQTADGAIKAITEAIEITAGRLDRGVGPISAIDHLVTYLVENELIDGGFWDQLPDNWLDQWEAVRFHPPETVQ